jgi:hypothetical protein
MTCSTCVPRTGAALRFVLQLTVLGMWSRFFIFFLTDPNLQLLHVKENTMDAL